MGTVIGTISAMRGHRVYVDTNVFIYFLERNLEFFSAAAAVIQAIRSQEFSGFTGEITVAETLVKPYLARDMILVADTKSFFDTSNFLTVLSHDKLTWDIAAQLRAAQRIKLVDAVHLATALKAACRYFVTNDKAMRSTGALSVVQLGSLL